jgi:hypothetical protein
MAKSRRQQDHFFRNFGLSLLGFVLGYYIFDILSRQERLPFGQVFYIVAGCVLMAVTAILMAVMAQRRYFPKKKRKPREKQVFLKDTDQKKHTRHEKN